MCILSFSNALDVYVKSDHAMYYSLHHISTSVALLTVESIVACCLLHKLSVDIVHISIYSCVLSRF